MKYFLSINEYGIIDEHRALKRFNKMSDELDRKEYSKMFNGDKLVAKVPLS